MNKLRKEEMFVPVVDSDSNPLMPTTPRRARRWVESGKATPFWKKGIWCVRLNNEPSARNKQTIVVGIDPGSKREGFTVKSELHTYLNIQAKAVDWVSKKVETRRNLRRARRSRKTPCRKPRFSNRKGSKLAPSTKARWQWKIRVVDWLSKMFPIEVVVVEDVKARSRKGADQRNKSFGPLQAGKSWFYNQLEERGYKVETLAGYETKELRDAHGLTKTSQKLVEKFEAHCVDSWVLANWHVGGHTKPDNTGMLIVEPLKKHYRNLHVQVPAKGGQRRNYGSTRSLGFERGSIVEHPKYGECLVGGNRVGRISLHNRQTNNRLCRNAKPEDIRFRCFNSFSVRKADG